MERTVGVATWIEQKHEIISCRRAPETKREGPRRRTTVDWAKNSHRNSGGEKEIHCRTGFKFEKSLVRQL